VVLLVSAAQGVTFEQAKVKFLQQSGPHLLGKLFQSGKRLRVLAERRLKLASEPRGRSKLKTAVRMDEVEYEGDYVSDYDAGAEAWDIGQVQTQQNEEGEQEVEEEGRCLGKRIDGECVCGKFQSGPLCRRRLQGRCRPILVEPPGVTDCIPGNTSEYKRWLDGDPPCALVNASDVVKVVYRFDCYVFDPSKLNEEGKFIESEARINETRLEQEDVNAVFIFRAVNWNQPYSDLRSVQRTTLSTKQMNEEEPFEVEVSLEQLNSWDSGYLVGGRFYFEGRITDSVLGSSGEPAQLLNQNYPKCASRFHLDLKDYTPPTRSQRRLPTWAIVIISLLVAAVVGAILMYIFLKSKRSPVVPKKID